jgi:hypothetical protein
MEARELALLQRQGGTTVRGLVMTLAMLLGVVVLAASAAPTTPLASSAATPTALADSDRCAQCEAFLAQAYVVLLAPQRPHSRGGLSLPCVAHPLLVVWSPQPVGQDDEGVRGAVPADVAGLQLQVRFPRARATH